MKPALEVLATGALVLIEDEGRPGHAAVGVGPSGAADRSAYRLGSRLVGHGDGRAALEVLLGGLSVRAHGRVTVALTGAHTPAAVDGRPVGHASLVEVADGSVLTLGMPSVGVRTYLTVRGGIDVDPVLGSRSTDTLSGVGPAPVGVGDVLPLGDPGTTFPEVDHVPHPGARRRCWRCCPGLDRTGSGGGAADSEDCSPRRGRWLARATGSGCDSADLASNVLPPGVPSSCPAKVSCAERSSCHPAASPCSSSPTTP